MRISDWSSDVCSSDLICASAKIEYGRAAVVQPLAQRSIVRFGPRLPLLNSPQLPVLRAGDRKKIRQEPRAIRGRCCKPGGDHIGMGKARFRGPGGIGGRAEERRVGEEGGST